MGEVPKNVYAVGCPSIDALLNEKDLSNAYIRVNKFKMIFQNLFNYNPASCDERITSFRDSDEKTIVALKKLICNI